MVVVCPGQGQLIFVSKADRPNDEVYGLLERTILMTHASLNRITLNHLHVFHFEAVHIYSCVVYEGVSSMFPSICINLANNNLVLIKKPELRLPSKVV